MRGTPQLNDAPDTKYKLTAVVHHHGLHASAGHYTTSAKKPGGGTWRTFNDSNTERCSKEKVLEDAAETGYVMFFERDDSSDGGSLTNCRQETESLCAGTDHSMFATDSGISGEYTFFFFAWT